MKPTLFLDVDGVINAFKNYLSAVDIEVHHAQADDGTTYRLDIPLTISEDLKTLREHYTIVWATTWQNANSKISPLVGLPKNLQKVVFPKGWQYDVPHNFGRKVPYIRDFAARNNIVDFVWLDDDIYAKDEAAFLEEWSTNLEYKEDGWRDLMVKTNSFKIRNMLLLQTDPRHGITAKNVRELIAFAQKCKED